ncbi:M18 family aminopeptidase [Naumannella halotolerans]|nr:M18 family aminopeptidase [Naumannella halotolerans]
MQPDSDELTDLSAFVQASPSAYHAAAETARRLTAAGWSPQPRTEAWDVSPGGHFTLRGGALIAWWVPESADTRSGYRIVGAHTDSPGFKLKPHPQLRRHGWDQLGVEVYGGPLLASWTDRDLGLAGRVVDRLGNEALIRTEAVARIPQLAIHLNRSVNADGLKLDPQAHTMPIIGLGERELFDLLLDGVDLPADPVGFDLHTYDTQPPAVIGAGGEFFASARLDNLSSVHAGLTALLEPADDHGPEIRVLAIFDHEEVGSASTTGAAGPLLEEVLRRTSLGLGADEEQHLAMLAGSSCVSSDAGHAVHPNYAEYHDPANHPLLNGGPLLKINANQRYATDGVGAALWSRVCDQAGVRVQPFVSNNAIPCGSTIGPITATRIGVTTVDVGVPLLSMHSARELAGTGDLLDLGAALRAYLWL